MKIFKYPIAGIGALIAASLISAPVLSADLDQKGLDTFNPAGDMLTFAGLPDCSPGMTFIYSAVPEEQTGYGMVFVAHIEVQAPDLPGMTADLEVTGDGVAPLKSATLLHGHHWSLIEPTQQATATVFGYDDVREQAGLIFVATGGGVYSDSSTIYAIYTAQMGGTSFGMKHEGWIQVGAHDSDGGLVAIQFTSGGPFGALSQQIAA